MIAANQFLQSLKKRAKPVPHEENECIALNGYLELLKKRHLFHYTHIPNGGLRDKKTAGRLRAMGVQKGVWDYLFRRESCAVHWLEMKHGDNDLSDDQMLWQAQMQPLGDTFDVCWSAQEALLSLVKRKIIPENSFRIMGSRAIAINLDWEPTPLKGARNG